MSTGSPIDYASVAAVIQAKDDENVHGVGYASYHEAYGVLLEEVEELFDEVKKRRAVRDLDRIRREATQIAAVAIRIAAMAASGDRGRQREPVAEAMVAKLDEIAKAHPGGQLEHALEQARREVP